MVTGSVFQSQSGLPYNLPNNYHAVSSPAARGATMDIAGLVFKDFGSRRCGGESRAITLHASSADSVMLHRFRDLELEGVSAANLVYLASPLEEWAEIEVCVQFPCTGRLNVLLQFLGETQHSPRIDALPGSEFSIISNNPEVAGGCTAQTAWNAYVCGATNWALLEFESLDSDKLDRSVQPVFVVKGEGRNKLNSFMDSARQGFYASQKRLSRFVSLVEVAEDFVGLEYTGTPPMRQLFGLLGAADYEFLKIRIDYTSPKTVRTVVGGETVAQNELKDGAMAALSGSGQCGENRWDAVQGVLEFVLQGGCELELKTLQTIQLGLRMDLTLEQFYSSDGELSFLQKMALQLNISRDRIKIVGIRRGSVILNVSIE